MKKIIKKVLKETLNDKNLQIAYVYFSNYMSTLEEVVKDNGDIYLREYGDIYAKARIQKSDLEFRLVWPLWDDLSELFFLKESDIRLIIKKWVENNYHFIVNYITRTTGHGKSSGLNIPTN